MNKKSDDDHDDIILIKSQLAIIRGFGKIVITACITATLSIVGILWNLGEWLYDNSGPIKAGIKAFLGARGSGQ